MKTRKLTAIAAALCIVLGAASCAKAPEQTTAAATTTAATTAETTTTAAETTTTTTAAETTTTTAAETTTTTTAEETEPETEAPAEEPEAGAAGGETEYTGAQAALLAFVTEDLGESYTTPSEIPPMSKEDFDFFDVDCPVVIESYIAAKQSWWEDNGVGQASFYLINSADEDRGGYFVYNMPCTEEEYEALVPGTHLRVYGFKAEWAGEIEIIDAQFEVIDGTPVDAEPLDVTELLSNEEELIKHQNEGVAFKGMTVEPSIDADGNEHAFFYKYDNSGSQGDDLYFNVSVDGNTYTFTVESYLCGPDTAVYQAVEALEVGEVVDLTGFLYWYNGPNPHILEVTPAAQ